MFWRFEKHLVLIWRYIYTLLIFWHVENSHNKDSDGRRSSLFTQNQCVCSRSCAHEFTWVGMQMQMQSGPPLACRRMLFPRLHGDLNRWLSWAALLNAFDQCWRRIYLLSKEETEECEVGGEPQISWELLRTTAGLHLCHDDHHFNLRCLQNRQCSCRPTTMNCQRYTWCEIRLVENKI